MDNNLGKMINNLMRELPDFMDSDRKSVLFWILESNWPLQFIFKLSSIE